MKKNCAIFLAFIFLLGCSSPPKEEIRIGVILPLTGNAAQYGVAMKNGIDLAYTESTHKSNIRLIYEDDRGEPKIGVNAVTKLISNDNINILIGGAMSSVAASIIPIASKHKIVVLSPYATAPNLFGEGKFFYSLLPSDDAEGAYIANYMAKYAIDSIGILYINTDYGVGITTTFTKGCMTNHLKVLFSEGYAQGETDFKTQLLKIKQLNVKALYLPGYYAETSKILRQVKELGCSFKIFGSSNFYDLRFIEYSNNSAEGVTFCYPSFNNDTTSIFQTFIDNYSVKYNKTPDAFAIQGYDCFKLIDKIILNNNFNKEIDFNYELKKIKNFQGVNSLINFSSNGSVMKKLNIYEIKDGKFELK